MFNYKKFFKILIIITISVFTLLLIDEILMKNLDYIFVYILFILVLIKMFISICITEDVNKIIKLLENKK